MPYLPRELRPEPTIDDAPFWAACRERRLVFQRCVDCGRFRHPPTPLCPACQSTRLAWETAHGTALLYTWTEVRHPAHPAVRERGPYRVAVIEFPEMNGVRLVSNLLDESEPRIGRPVELAWDDAGDGLWLPRFRQRADA